MKEGKNDDINKRHDLETEIIEMLRFLKNKKNANKSLNLEKTP